MSEREYLPSKTDAPHRLESVELDVRRTGALVSERPRPIVVVLGMHRSGTSLLSNALHVLGVDMADETDHVSPKNPGGFWERPELVAIHDEILAAMGRPISLPSHVLPFRPAWWRAKEVQALKPKLKAYLREQLADSENPWGFKDPRTCRMLPLWREVFRELNLEPVYVVAVRRPAESSVSMSRKSPARRLSVASGELMWLSYNYDIARHVLLKSPAIVVDYDEWFADASAVGQRLAETLGLGELSSEEISECMSSIVHSEYRHQTESDSAAIPVAAMLYNALGSGDVRALRSQVRLAELFFKSLGPVAEDLDAAAMERTSLLAERDELTEKAARIPELEQQLSDTRSQVSRLQEEKGAIQLQVDGAVERLRQAEKAASASTAEREKLTEQLSGLGKRAEELEAGIARERNRSGELLKSAEKWRRSYEAEHGETAGRLESAKRAAELQAKLETSEARLKVEQDQNAALVAALEARDTAMKSLRQRRPEASVASTAEERAFAWPSAGVEGAKPRGALDAVDESGLAGHAWIEGRPELVPILEVRIDGAVVLGQSCSADGSVPSEEGCRFFIPWSRFAAEHAGQEAVVLISGWDHELGRAAIPSDLNQFHLSPATRAAEIIGGTISEAAEYHRWIVETEGPEDEELARAYRAERTTAWPKINVIIYGDDRKLSRPTLRSLQEQVYGNWEAICLNEDLDIPEARPRIRRASRSELDRLASEYPPDALFTFVEAGDVLSSTALLHLAEAAVENPEFALIYSDEDRIELKSGLRAMPYMKGAWSTDLALVQDYATRLALIRRNSTGTSLPSDAAAVYRATIGAALSGTDKVVHLPFVLYHRSVANVRPADLSDAVEDLIESTPELSGTKLLHGDDGRLKIAWPIPEPAPLVSLIVPTRDQVDLLRVCVDGLLHETDYKNLEVLIADNDSQEEATKLYLEKVGTHPRVRVIPCPGPFNFSSINNLAATQAKGSLIGLINNDLKVLNPNWLSEMVSHAVRPDVGIVGAKLLYEDGSIQHAGVTLGIGLASHLYKSFPGEAEGRNGRLVYPQDVSAVTAACLLMRRDVWDEVGGLDEEFPVAYNDVDLCLKVRVAGYRVLWTPDATVYHLESRSRGKDVTAERRERLNRDKERLEERWGDLLTSDPFHSPNLSAKHVDARLSIPPRVSARWQPKIAAE